MRIAYLTVFHPCGTREQFVEPEIGELVRRGHDVIVTPLRPGSACSATAGRLRAQRTLSWRCLGTALRRFLLAPLQTIAAVGPTLATSPLNIGRNLLTIPKALWLATILRQERIDHVHAQWGTTTATAAMIAARLERVPWSFTVHRHDVLSGNALAAKARSATFVRFPSKASFDDARRVDPKFPIERGLLAHMGVRIPTHLPEAAQVPYVVLCPGALTKRKGQATLLRAIAQLPDLPIEGWFAGSGEDEDSLRALAEDLGLGAERARFLGQMTHGDLLNLYAGARIWTVALPTEHEGIPFALLEAMSYGIPVVSTPVGGIPELFEGGTGELVPVGDAERLAATLRHLFEVPEHHRTLSARARRRVADEFELERTVEILEAAMAVTA